MLILKRLNRPHIASCHARDIILREDNYILILDELMAGLGKLDYVAYLQKIAKLNDVPLNRVGNI